MGKANAEDTNSAGFLAARTSATFYSIPPFKSRQNHRYLSHYMVNNKPESPGNKYNSPPQISVFNYARDAMCLICNFRVLSIPKSKLLDVPTKSSFYSEQLCHCCILSIASRSTASVSGNRDLIAQSNRSGWLYHWLSVVSLYERNW